MQEIFCMILAYEIYFTTKIKQITVLLYIANFEGKFMPSANSIFKRLVTVWHLFEV